MGSHAVRFHAAKGEGTHVIVMHLAMDVENNNHQDQLQHRAHELEQQGEVGPCMLC
jgi:hypothetical protein